MTIQYKTQGVCSQQMNVKIEDGVVQKVEIVGGCHGNCQGVARLVEGMPVEEAIRRLEGRGELIALPDKLRQAALLRLAHPEDTLAQLAERFDPPITKSALNHRLRKLVELGRES